MEAIWRRSSITFSNGLFKSRSTSANLEVFTPHEVKYCSSTNAPFLLLLDTIFSFFTKTKPKKPTKKTKATSRELKAGRGLHLPPITRG